MAAVTLASPAAPASPASFAAGAAIAVARTSPRTSTSTPGVLPVPSDPGQTADPGSGEPAGWAWPLSPRPAVIGPFDPPLRRWLAGHRGVDLSAATGEPVLAPADGVVTFAGRVAGRPVLSLGHNGGLRSTYEPVVGALSVGSVVRAGDVVGHLSSQPGHCAPAVCLHWGALRGTMYVDPLALLGRTPIILLPVP